MKQNIIAFILLFSFLVVKSQSNQQIVLFDFDKYDIPDSAMLQLMKILAKQKIQDVTIEGHCDSVGSKLYNYKLSVNRANAVKKLLVQNGVDTKIIKTCIGYGKEKPLLQNGDYTEAYLNRRVIVHFNVNEIKSPISEIENNLSKLETKKFQPGERIKLDNLFFYGGRHVLREESLPVLKQLCKIMKAHPLLKIEIQGHVCCTTLEPDGYDIDLGTDNLSLTRAKTVYDYLVHLCSIDSKRLSYKGFGGSMKVVQEEITEEDKRKNRRVELLILE